ncbi:tRNA (guanine(10)-N2)-methyltransferase [Escovopsis weberi]|uniref:tRNA (guanine(10)-N(2))-methyltransferase n=1 Tax=Escovopsis weberi TaxID=150374 RepID=A0A0M8N934_ESCWE|nr:tRNA (guanine(10)-N2)-methyltransferase [Escovopsis weberi]
MADNVTDFMIKFASEHESFWVAEIEALAIIENIDLQVLHYSKGSPFVLVRLPSAEAAARLLRRSVLAHSIYEHWGTGTTLEQLHESVRARTAHLWPRHKHSSFKFIVDCYQGARPHAERIAIIESFSFLGFDGPIRMADPDETFVVLEQWPFNSVPKGLRRPEVLYLGRRVALSGRDVITRFDLKKRSYISTTSMDAELSLVTANIALAAPGKLFYDPFVGTGSFPIACAHFGAFGWGSDIDGRSIRGEAGARSLAGNFEQYGIRERLGGTFAADLTNSPVRKHRRTWDGIVCDPPYGVREGLKVLGLKDPKATPWLVERGVKDAMSSDYIPPKKPYSFLAMLHDILTFATDTLVDNGRLAFWMPSANDEEQEIPIPEHPSLELVAVCIQDFSKYELNPFRRGYFKKFELDE